MLFGAALVFVLGGVSLFVWRRKIGEGTAQFLLGICSISALIAQFLGLGLMNRFADHWVIHVDPAIVEEGGSAMAESLKAQVVDWGRASFWLSFAAVLCALLFGFVGVFASRKEAASGE